MLTRTEMKTAMAKDYGHAAVHPNSLVGLSSSWFVTQKACRDPFTVLDVINAETPDNILIVTNLPDTYYPLKDDDEFLWWRCRRAQAGAVRLGALVYFRPHELDQHGVTGVTDAVATKHGVPLVGLVVKVTPYAERRRT